MNKPTRDAIIVAAHAAGFITAYQFAKRCETLGIPYSTAYGYYTGQHDISGEKVGILLKYFKVEV